MSDDAPHKEHWCWVFPGLSGLRKAQIKEIYDNMRERGYGTDAIGPQIKHLSAAINTGRRQYWDEQQSAKQRGDLLTDRAAGMTANSRGRRLRTPLPAAKCEIPASEVNEMLRSFPNPNFPKL